MDFSPEKKVNCTQYSPTQNMLKNYIKTTLRNLSKHKSVTVINLSGLAIGISASLIIFLIIQHQLSFDKYEPDHNRIYRIVSHGQEWTNGGATSPMHTAAAEELTGLETTAGFFKLDAWQNKVTIPTADKAVAREYKNQDETIFTDKNFFTLFPREWITGNAAASLQQPGQVVLTEAKAHLYFPGVPLIDIPGRLITFNDSINAVVSGIVKDLKVSSDFNYKAFLSLSTIPNSSLKKYYALNDWTNNNSNSQVIVKLLPGTTAAHVNKALAAIAIRHKTGDAIADQTQYELQPLSDVHFNYSYGGTASKQELWNLGILALFLLLLGSINFINLSTAQAIYRAREIGVRKTLGSSRKQLIFQFLSETILLTTIAAVLSLAATPLLLKAFTGFIPENLHFSAVSQYQVLLFIAALIVLVGILAGIYPAIILTRFNPVKVLKNQTLNNGESRGAWQRKTLTVTQFVIAQVFVTGTFVVKQQIWYSLNKDMGFKKEATLAFRLPDNISQADKKITFRNQLRNLPGVEAASIGVMPPAIEGAMINRLTYQQGKNVKDIMANVRMGDTGYISLYHIRLLAGRNVLPTDSATEFLINESMAHEMGFQQPAAAIGQHVKLDGRPIPVVGVMKDFDLGPTRMAHLSAAFYSSPKYGFFMHVALQPDAAQWQQTLAAIEKQWKTFFPGNDFGYHFADERIKDFYSKETDLSWLLTWSSSIAIFISCLGLLGLAIFTTNQRIREIGIRKILGASATQIISLLSRDFVTLVIIAFVTAIPIAWFTSYKWLQHFAFRITLHWYTFALSGVVMLLLTVLILGIRTGKAAAANPVKHLRND